MPNDNEIEDRRKFLISCGRFAAVTPPVMTLLLSTSLTSTAIAGSGYGGQKGSHGRSFFDNEPDGPKEKPSSDRGSRDHASKGNNNQAPATGGGGGGGGADGGGAGGASGGKAGGNGSSGSSGGGRGGSGSRSGGGEDDKSRKASKL
jgi:hypothetical protein